MTTPNGLPTEAKPLQYRDLRPGDAAVQAAAGEATVRGTNQDVTPSAQADVVTSGLSALKGGIANDEQGQPFTGSV
jgi:hypothetical protein